MSMDINQIRTFLAVAETGSFVAAAERVHVTQSTVSVRIRTLEEALGAYLFERGKQGATLTAAGRQFQKHALALSKIWAQARLDVGVSEDHEAVLRIGAQNSLWDGYLVTWLPWMRRHAPDVAIRAEIGYPDQLIQKLTEGSLDIGVMYRPQQRAGLRVRQLFEEELIMVSSAGPGEVGREAPDEDYALITWGPDFQGDHAVNFPDMETPRVILDIGSFAVNYLLNSPVRAYLPRRLAAPQIRQGKLFPISGAPKFSYPAYAVYQEDLESGLMDLILSGLYEIRDDLPGSGLSDLSDQ